MKTPKQIIIETTGRCNLACPGCYREQGSHAEIDMPMETFEGILREASQWVPKPEIIPFCHGEPLMDPLFRERLGLIESFGLKYKFCSNGTLWSERVFPYVLSSRLCQHVLFSIDGWRPETIAETRGVSGLRAPENMRRLIEMRPSFESTLQLGVRMRRHSQDFEEVQQYIEGWLEAGVDMVLVCRDVAQEARAVRETEPKCNYLEGMNAVVLADGSMHVCDRRVPTPGYFRLSSWAELWRDVVEAGRTGPCATCPQRYNGAGTVGRIAFRDRPDRFIHFKEDQFQQFYSLVDVRKGVSWGHS